MHSVHLCTCRELLSFYWYWSWSRNVLIILSCFWNEKEKYLIYNIICKKRLGSMFSVYHPLWNIKLFCQIQLLAVFNTACHTVDMLTQWQTLCYLRTHKAFIDPRETWKAASVLSVSTGCFGCSELRWLDKVAPAHRATCLHSHTGPPLLFHNALLLFVVWWLWLQP